jgi:hypothetical protein
MVPATRASCLMSLIDHGRSSDPSFSLRSRSCHRTLRLLRSEPTLCFTKTCTLVIIVPVANDFSIFLPAIPLRISFHLCRSLALHSGRYISNQSWARYFRTLFVSSSPLRHVRTYHISNTGPLPRPKFRTCVRRKYFLVHSKCYNEIPTLR